MNSSLLNGISLDIGDVIIQNTNGQPYYASCFGSDHCHKEKDHTLMSGFFAAINNFKSEFMQNSLQLVEFNEIKIIVESCEEFLLTMTVATDDDKENARLISKQILEKFRECYMLFIRSKKQVNLNHFIEFRDWIEKYLEHESKNLLPKLGYPNSN